MAAFWWMIAIVVTATLAFIPAIVWMDNGRKEREAHYRSETARQISEADDPQPIIEYYRETERIDAARTRTKARVAGVITVAVGIALMIFFYQIVPGQAVYLAGLIPLLVGVGLLLLSEVIMKPEPTNTPSPPERIAGK